MFESICIRHQSNSDLANPIDLGFLAETMLFYSDVVIIAKQNMLEQLIRGCGPEIIIELLKAGFIKIRYEHKLTGIATDNTGTSQERHSGIIFSSPDHALQHIAPKLFTKVTGHSGRGRRLGIRFSKYIQTVEREPSVLTDFTADLGDKQFIQAAVGKLLRLYAPEYHAPEPLLFNIDSDDKGFTVKTNIDFSQANKSYHLHIPPSHSSLSNAYFLSHILTTRDNLFFASSMKADLAVDTVNSQLLVTKIDNIMDRYNKHISQMNMFQDFVIEDGKAIREAINGGHRTFADLIKLLERAQEFRKWLKDKPEDINLVKAYFKEVTQSSWIDKLPGKSFRWSFFTCAGLVLDSLGGGGLGTAMGVALGATDVFILDKLIKGWRPNHFVEGPLQKFIKSH